MARMYEPSWLALKKSVLSPKRIVIAAPAIFHPRIYKAIKKEKDMDVVFKMELAEREIPQTAKLSSKSDGGKLTIFLHFSLGMDDL